MLLIEHNNFLASNLPVKKSDEVPDKMFKRVILTKERQ